MPTDPFVNPDLDDRPRHRQNLPAGVALPPASRWTADRPGDLAGGQPVGELLGAPGPNVGFAYTLAQRSGGDLQISASEHLEDAIVVVAEIAMKRAAGLGRAPVVGDVEVAISLLGYDGSASPDFVARRAHLVHGAAHQYESRRRLVDTVPADLLVRPRAELVDVAGAWRASLGSDPRVGG